MKRFMSVLMWLLVALLVLGQAEAGVVGYWPLNGNADDYSGNGLDGTINGTAASVSGIVGGALDFDGSTTYVDAGMPSLLGFTDENISIEAWVKPEAITGYVGIAGGMSQVGNTYYTLAADANAIPWFGLRGLIEGGNIGERWAINYVGPILPIGSWTHIVGTREPGGIVYPDAALTIGKLYVNGVLVTTAPDSRLYMPEILDPQGLWAFRIGTRGYLGGDLFNGAIDEVAVYDHALSAQEVAAHYLDGLAGIPAVGLPVANAGVDIIATTADTIILNGSGSSGTAISTVVSYAWDLNGDSVVDVTGVNPDVTGEIGGKLSVGAINEVSLTVTDNLGSTSVPDKVLVVVADVTSLIEEIEDAEECLTAIQTSLGITDCDASAVCGEVIYVSPGILNNQQGLSRNPNAGKAVLLCPPTQ